MGIQGLLKALEGCQTDRHVADYAGKTAAVDALGWLHRGLSACALELATGRPSKAHIRFCVRRAAMVRRCGVTPVLVFDGEVLPGKRAVNEERRRQREASRLEGERRLRLGDLRGARKCLARSVAVTGDMIRALSDELESSGIASMMAPYEADAQIAYLSMTGLVDFCISEDSDLLAWGCRRVLFRMDSQGRGKEVALDDVLRGRSHDEFRAACILMGCDYLPRLPRVGPVTAFRLVDRCGPNLAAILRELRDQGVDVPGDYWERFKVAWLVFLYQPVLDPLHSRLLPLERLETGLTTASLPPEVGWTCHSSPRSVVRRGPRLPDESRLCTRGRDQLGDVAAAERTDGVSRPRCRLRPPSTPRRSETDPVPPSPASIASCSPSSGEWSTQRPYALQTLRRTGHQRVASWGGDDGGFGLKNICRSPLPLPPPSVPPPSSRRKVGSLRGKRRRIASVRVVRGPHVVYQHDEPSPPPTRPCEQKEVSPPTTPRRRNRGSPSVSPAPVSPPPEEPLLALEDASGPPKRSPFVSDEWEPPRVSRQPQMTFGEFMRRARAEFDDIHGGSGEGDRGCS